MRFAVSCHWFFSVGRGSNYEQLKSLNKLNFELMQINLQKPGIKKLQQFSHVQLPSSRLQVNSNDSIAFQFWALYPTNRVLDTLIWWYQIPVVSIKLVGDFRCERGFIAPFQQPCKRRSGCGNPEWLGKRTHRWLGGSWCRVLWAGYRRHRL